MILKDSQSHIPWEIFKEGISELLIAAENLDTEKIQLLLRQIIPTYNPRSFTPKPRETSVDLTIKGQA